MRTDRLLNDTPVGVADERDEWLESVDGLIAARGPNLAVRILADCRCARSHPGSVNCGVDALSQYDCGRPRVGLSG